MPVQSTAVEVNCETGEVTETPVTVYPKTLVANPASIPPDGTTASTVTYTDESPDAPAQVTFSANGASTTEALTNGTASIEVVSTSASDTIAVTCEATSCSITVEAA